MAWVTAVAWVQSLDKEIDEGVAKEKKLKKFKKKEIKK